MSKIKAELIDWMGDDSSVVDAARVSFAKRSDNYTYEQNESLIRFLARERHEIPFAHTAITFRCKAPIFVARQAFKHKIGFVENEVSRRYVSDEPEFFMPDEWREAASDKKQGSGCAHPGSWIFSGYASLFYDEALDLYNMMIKDGVAPEQARMVLPQAMMTEWVWTGSLLAYARFYNLRAKPDAQKEIQELANMIGEVLKDLFPIGWEALTNG